MCYNKIQHFRRGENIMIAFFVTFLAILLAELGDKSQLVTLTLSTRFPPRQVVAGALGALAALTALAAALGDFMADLLPETTILIASALFFFAVGTWMVFRQETPDGEVEEPRHGVATQTFAMIFLAELGDKTQLTVIALTAAYGTPIPVFLGAMAAQFVNHGAAAYLGSRYLTRLPGRTIKIVSAALFFFFGAAMLYSAIF
ncbi:protein of unknown function UPF0016 [Dethiobacter alkaliphilus AHT 1]|uniref:GDT1 family protein n=2 Tax=Dethiobacter TaxID=427925 RepID=C0GK95_DETAL|nr:protein of unknown function UPF0016 [Dethiobacter alkaliphilus AHT 1]